MLSKLSIRFRLSAVTLLLGGLALLLGGLGMAGMHQSLKGIEKAHDEELQGTIALSTAESYIGRQRTSLDQAALRPQSDTATYMFGKEKEVKAVYQKWWSDYLALPKDVEEKRLAEQMGTEIDKTQASIDAFRRAIVANQTDDIPKQAQEVGKVYTNLQVVSGQLKDYQARAAQKNLDEAHHRYTEFVWVSGLALLLAVLAIGYGRWTIQRAIVRPISRALEHFDRIEKGDLTSTITVHSTDEMGQLLEGLRRMRDGLVQTVSTVRSGSSAIAAATHQIAAGNMDLSSRTEEQASALQETAASMEELSTTVSQNAQTAEHANVLARSAAEIATRGSQMVSTMVEVMSEINTESAKIAEITSLIEGIAFQTNILSLNAAVEAARAGEQGRGFAVVANEVRSLAQRSASAASEIKKMINESVERAKNGAQQAQDTGTTITEMNQAVERVSKLIAEISSASDEQRKGIEQVTQAVSQMDAVTQQNAALVEEASATAQALDDQARELSASVDAFQIE